MSEEAVFTPSILAQQKALGSRVGAPSFPSVLTPALMGFVSERDSAYLATANAAGLPTIQHRGGPVGFIRKVDNQTIGFADFDGNRQYISYGNIAENPKACLFLMDYENRWRLKIWGDARISSDPGLLASLTPDGYVGKARRSLLLRVLAWDDNCSSHIPVKIDAIRVNARVSALQSRIDQLEGAVARVVEVGWRRNLRLVQRAMTGVGTPAEITPWNRIARRRKRTARRCLQGRPGLTRLRRASGTECAVSSRNCWSRS